MNNPNDVELLIFDLDGTLFQSDKANYDAIKKALSEMKWFLQIDEEDIKKHLGEPSEQFYRNVLPSDKFPLWQDFRTMVRNQYTSSIKKFGKVFPDVIETLKKLKGRGYKLALYSNCSKDYFNAALSSLNIEEYFDYIECNQENNLTKTELIKKIIKKFSGVKIAVIGDRIHDIEAAKKNNSLSVGVLYGYGKDEPKKADIQIVKFSDLLNVFDRRLPIFERILVEIKKRKQKNRAFVVGINGIDTSGKTIFAKYLQKFLIEKNFKIQVINLDDFHNPKEMRYSGENQADNYYNKSFNIKTIVEQLLIPVHQNKEHKIKLTLLDLHSNKYEVEKDFSFDSDTIVVFEGVFLFRKELLPYIDFKIFIEIPLEESKNRAKERDVPIYGVEVLKKYDEKYIPAQKKYLEECPPSKVADIIIDNTNLEFPKIVK